MLRAEVSKAGPALQEPPDQRRKLETDGSNHCGPCYNAHKVKCTENWLSSLFGTQGRVETGTGLALERKEPLEWALKGAEYFSR